jgi:hypothetical protein
MHRQKLQAVGPVRGQAWAIQAVGMPSQRGSKERFVMQYFMRPWLYGGSRSIDPCRMLAGQRAVHAKHPMQSSWYAITPARFVLPYLQACVQSSWYLRVSVVVP